MCRVRGKGKYSKYNRLVNIGVQLVTNSYLRQKNRLRLFDSGVELYIYLSSRYLSIQSSHAYEKLSLLLFPLSHLLVPAPHYPLQLTPSSHHFPCPHPNHSFHTILLPYHPLQLIVFLPNFLLPSCIRIHSFRNFYYWRYRRRGFFDRFFCKGRAIG